MMENEAVGPYQVLETVSVERLVVTLRARRGREPSVLIKTAKPGLTNVAPAARALEREIEVFWALRHPAWPTLIEVLRDGPTPALVLVDRAGHRLDAVLRQATRIAPSSAMAIAIEVALGLGALHRVGGSHAAWRPSMVELTAQGGVCLHAPVAAEPGPSDLDAPEYLSPEQIIGDEADARSDVFLIGGLLYRMLTGRSPFEGDREGVSQRVRHAPPLPLGEKAVRIPSSLQAIVMGCLEKRRHDRFPDLASVAARLTRSLRQETSLPSDVLVARVLAEIGLGEGLPEPLDRKAVRGSAFPALQVPRSLALLAGVGALVLVGALVWRLGGDAAEDGPTGARGVLDESGHLRVLARPWAELIVDGRRIDVTPIGAPLAVSPGKHSVILRHPSAPDETRSIELISGQTVLIDVDMKVTYPPKASAPTHPSASPSASPLPSR